MSAPANQQPPANKSSDLRIAIKSILLIVGCIILIGVIDSLGTSHPAPATHTSSTSSTSPANTDSSSAPAAVPTPPPTCTTYQPLDNQSWLEIVKDPQAYLDNCYTVYGEVTQFDSVTGTGSFLAEVGGVEQTPQYGFVSYPTTTYLTGDPTTLQNVVQQDLFTANVMVLGTQNYQTVTGAQLTVPDLQVNSIQVTGTVGN